MFKSSVILLSISNAQQQAETSDTLSQGWSNFWDYALDIEGPAGHSHAADPSFDGHCVACVGARRIFCLDGDDNNQNREVQDYGSC